MDSNPIVLALLLTPTLASAQANTEHYLAREGGRTYHGNYASLESPGGQGQYGTYVFVANSGGRTGTHLGSPYRAYRYGSRTPYDSAGSYQQGRGPRSGLNSFGTSGMGRTGGGVQ